MLKFFITLDIVLLVFLLIVFIFHKLTARYVSPYTLDIFFGRKGCGKSSTLQKLAQKYHKKGWKIFCDNGNTMQPFVTQIDCKRLYAYQFPENSVILIDEINLLWDNRDFKSFPKELQKMLRLQRHRRIKIIMFSQTYDCDLKIRNLADHLYLCNKFLRCWTVATAYVKRPVVLTSEQTTTEARMSDDFKKLPFWYNRITFIPAWVKNYDSFKDDTIDYLYVWSEEDDEFVPAAFRRSIDN